MQTGLLVKTGSPRVGNEAGRIHGTGIENAKPQKSFWK